MAGSGEAAGNTKADTARDLPFTPRGGVTYLENSELTMVSLVSYRLKR